MIEVYKLSSHTLQTPTGLLSSHTLQTPTGLLSSHTLQTTPTGLLNYEISIEELNDASYVLEPGKAPGWDNILNEMVSCFLRVYPNIVPELFNAILSQCTQITCWNTAIINPIYKNELKSIVHNYIITWAARFPDRQT